MFQMFNAYFCHKTAAQGKEQENKIYFVDLISESVNNLS